VQGEILNLLTRLQRELGLTYIIITHNLAVVRHVSDEMAVMYMGRFVEHGPTKAIFAQRLIPIPTACSRHSRSPTPTGGATMWSCRARSPASRGGRPAASSIRAAARAGVVPGGAPGARTLAPGHDHRCHFPLVETASA